MLSRFGAQVRDLRRTAGLTQETVSEHSGLHVTYIAGIEAGKRNPTYLSIMALALGLGVTPESLFAERELTSPPVS